MWSVRSFALVVASVVISVLAACVGDDPVGFDASDAGAVSVGTDGESTSEGGVPPLGCPLGCLPLAPPGWLGPSAVFDGPFADKPAACPEAYTQKEVEVHQGMTAAPAVCACGTPQASVAAAKCAAPVKWYPSTTCTGVVTSFAAVAPGTTCSDKPAGMSSVVVGTPSFSGTCAFPNATKTLPPAAFAKAGFACGLPQVASCAGRPECTATPLPAAPFTRLCLHKDGDASCPSADYAARFVAYRTFKEGRDCTACVGTASGNCGTTSVAGASAGCLGTQVGMPTNGVCQNGAGVGSISISTSGPITASLSCTTTTASQPSAGVATSEDAVTFCCNK